jgi:hypothetical protein
MKPSWLFKRLFLAVTSSAVVASPTPKPALAAGPTANSTSIFDFGNEAPLPTTPTVQPATRPGIRPDRAAVKPAATPVLPVTPPATGDAPARLRLPTKDEQAAAERLIREAYAKKYADPAPAAKAALAADLLRQADDPSNSPAAQFVLLRDAADVSARVGDAPTSMNAITAAARRYQLDPPQELKVRASGMALAARAATGAESLKEIAGQSLALSGSALRLEQFDTADRLVAAAGVAAAKTKDAALIRSVQEQSRDLNAARMASGAARNAAEVLAKNPADPAANLAVGRYRCLVLGDWGGGLPLLAKGSDAALKALAARDIAQQGPATAVDVGDGWWDFAEKQQGTGKTECRARAGYWYQAALPTLGGLLKTRVESRLEIAGTSTSFVAGAAKGRVRATTETASANFPPNAIAPVRGPNEDPERVLWFRGDNSEESLVQAIRRGKIRTVAKGAETAAMGDPKTYLGPHIMVWGVNRWREAPLEVFTPSVCRALQQFVRDGGDLVMFEQFDMTHMKIIDELFGVKTEGGSSGARVVLPALKAGVAEAGLTDRDLDKVNFFNSYGTLPKDAAVLVQDGDGHDTVVVVPFGHGRLILIGTSPGPLQIKLVGEVLDVIYHGKLDKP